MTQRRASGAIGNDGATTGDMVVGGGGTLVLTGDNTYSDGTTVDSGATLSISAADNIGTGTLTLQNGATLDLSAAFNLANAISLSGAATIKVTNFWNSLLDPIAGAGSLNVTGGGGLALESDDNTYSGGTTVNGGALDISLPGAPSGKGR